MNGIGIGRVAALAVVFSFAVVGCADQAIAQDRGSLEGVITDSEGEPLRPEIQLFRDGMSVGTRGAGEGGFYHIEDLAPGLYEVVVTPRSPVLGRDRPKRYLGVLIKAGKPTQLNVQLKKGRVMEVEGQSVVDYPPAILVSEALDQLKKEIENLKKELEETKKEVEELKKK